MERVMGKQSCVPNSLAFSKEFTDNIESQEIIKTDAANFRVLVQRLTGKPTDSNCGKKKMKILFSNKPMAKQMELTVKSGFQATGFRERIKGDMERSEVGWWGRAFSGSVDGTVLWLLSVVLTSQVTLRKERWSRIRDHIDRFGTGGRESGLNLV
ncbi:VQ motif-containing protein domain-containing protein [Forsythia ovata]|uniref:VQ motif-containing protein domain-containing protein n=1 Tax=Forsythia ovata TaxID=205694 RepID=A0ABD1TR90_9LAMI